ncbi:MAG TPA: hypothetical protein VFX27_04960 [Sphingobium sp.]|nr:hypothetical protein [Sphingobium sp.]
MKISFSMIALPMLVALSGCNNEPEQIGGGPMLDDPANNAAAVALPPMVVKSKTYRCGDGSLLFVDYMSDEKTAMLRTSKEGTATPLTMAEPGKPYSAAGHSLSGNGDVVTAELPGKGSQTCKS